MPMPTEQPPGAGKPIVKERCFSGALTRIGVNEVLSFLALGGKTGKLVLTRRDGSGIVVLRSGRIIYAASSSVRETLGSILVCRKLIGEDALAEALERQHSSVKHPRLGSVLVEMGHLRREDVEEAIRYQVGRVLAELVLWTDGFFRFDAMEITRGDEIEVDAQDFVVAEGLSTERVLLSLAIEGDERERVDEATAEHPPGLASSAAEAGGSVGLSRILEQVSNPALPGEKTLTILDFASKTLSRGVLFVVRGDRVEGIGHFGLPPDRASSLRPEILGLSLEEASVVSEVVHRREPYRGALLPVPGNDRLLALLGGDRPEQVLALPLVVDGRVALVLYGDNGARAQPIGPSRPLELALARTGLEIEKQALERRLRSFGAEP